MLYLADETKKANQHTINYLIVHEHHNLLCTNQGII